MSPFQRRIAELITAAVTQLSGNFSVAELGKVLQRFLISAMEAAAVLLANEGKEKKELVLQALGQAVDAVPLPFWLAIFRPLVKSVVLAIANGAIEAIYGQFKEQINAEAS